MLTEICQYLRNWFNRKPDGGDYPKYNATFIVSDGGIAFEDGSGLPLLEGQHFRILGSVLNEGVYRHPATGLKDETFTGAVWAMAVPPEVLTLAEEIGAWQSKYGGSDSTAMSPYSSESFGGYSYTKGSGTANADGTSGTTTWQSTFAARLAPWRKI